MQEHLYERPEITITYFEPDTYKDGGAYKSITGIIKKIDFSQRQIILYAENGISNGLILSTNDILEIECRLFME